MKAFRLEQKKTETELTVKTLRLPTREELDEHFGEVSLLYGRVSLTCFWDIDEETFDGGEEDGTWGANPFDTGFVLIIPVAVVEETVSVGDTYLLNGVPFTAVSDHDLLCATFTDYVSSYDGIPTYKEFLGLTDPGRFLGEEYVKYDLEDSDDAWDDEEEEEGWLFQQDLSAFETVKFGPYEWLVLDQNDKGKLLITKDAVAFRPYHAPYRLYHGDYCGCTWETSALRAWLNQEFLDRFSEEERKLILETCVKNTDNSEYGTEGGNDTKDKVFLLSIEECQALFDKDEARICMASDEAIDDGIEDGAYVEGACWWWLRSPGETSADAACVYDFGGVAEIGDRVYNDHFAVRPALWVNLKS